jgi:Rad9
VTLIGVKLAIFAILHIDALRLRCSCRCQHSCCDVYTSRVPAEKLQAKKGAGMLRTRIQMDARGRDLFKSYSNTSKSIGDVTFNLRDFGAIVYFCRHTNADVLLSMDSAGSPLVAEASWPDQDAALASEDHAAAHSAAHHVQAELVLATMADSVAVRLGTCCP